MGFVPITLPVSKEVVLIQSVSPFLINKFKRRYSPPAPPVERVNLGTEEAPDWEETPNAAHPDYIEARKAWAEDLEERTRRFMIALGAEVEWTDAKRERLARLRAAIAKEGDGLEIEEEDNYAYISYVAVQSGEDYKALLEAIINGSRPSEEAITEATATFRPDINGQRADLQGQEHLR